MYSTFACSASRALPAPRPVYERIWRRGAENIKQDINEPFLRPGHDSKMMNRLYQLLFNALSGSRPSLTIVMFHRVPAAPDPLLPDENDYNLFNQRVKWLTQNFVIMTLREAVQKLRQGSLPRRALVITFDDGYADNATNALPILQAHGVRATFFVTSRFIHGGMMWNDRVIEAIRAWNSPTIEIENAELPAIPVSANRAETVEKLLNSLKYVSFHKREAIADALLESSGSQVSRLMMDEDQIRTLHAAGMEIGGHTHSHPIMTRLDEEQIREEILSNKQHLETIINGPVSSFAYPNGRSDQDYCYAHTELVRSLGFDCAVTTMPGTVSALDRPYEIPRFSPWDRTRHRYLLRLARNYFQAPVYASTVAT